jgi:hypothetical protein
MVTTAEVEIKKVKIPNFLRNMPDNVSAQLVGVPGGYRLQRSLGEQMRLEWRKLVPQLFNVRANLGLPVSGQFRDAFTYRISEKELRFVVKPCADKNGFNYAPSLMHGRGAIEGAHFVPALDVLLPGGSTRGTTSDTFDKLMSQMTNFFRGIVGPTGRRMMARAVEAAQ